MEAITFIPLLLLEYIPIDSVYNIILLQRRDTQRPKRHARMSQ